MATKYIESKEYKRAIVVCQTIIDATKQQELEDMLTSLSNNDNNAVKDKLPDVGLPDKVKNMLVCVNKCHLQFTSTVCSMLCQFSISRIVTNYLTITVTVIMVYANNIA